jgi:hypothetical protein
MAATRWQTAPVRAQVLVGSGQGFYMAFGTDIQQYRSFSNSILALLRMAVGDFDYGPGPPGAVKRP